MKYDIYEWHGASVALATNPDRLAEIREVLDEFVLRPDHLAPDPLRRNRSLVVEELQARFKEMGWATEVLLGTHHVDCVRGRIAIEIEWHSTDKVFARDLLNFEQLRRAGRIDVGVIVTRGAQLREAFRQAGKPDHSSTSHIAKLRALMDGTIEGDCPVLAFALSN